MLNINTIITALWCAPLLVLAYRLFDTWRSRRRAAEISEDVGRHIEEYKQMLAAPEPNAIPRVARIWKEEMPGIHWTVDRARRSSDGSGPTTRAATVG